MYAPFPIQWLLYTVLNLYFYVIVASAILSWLVAFNVINTRNQFVYRLGDILYRLTEPAMRPIRRVIPAVGGLDLSPIVLLLGISFLQILIVRFVHF